MNWLSFIWSMTAGICLTFGVTHALVWLHDRNARANLVFAIGAFGAAGYATVDLLQLQSATPNAYAEAARWTLALGTVVTLSLAWFIRLYLQAGRWWLLWVICSLRALILVLNFALEPNFYFTAVTGLQPLTLLGQPVVAPIGVRSPWSPLQQLSHVLVVIYMLDAARTAAKQSGYATPWRGSRATPWLLGSTIAAGIVLASVATLLRAKGVLPSAFVAQIMLLIFAVMFYELSVELNLSVRLEGSLRESEARLRIAAHAADLGLWEWDIRREISWANDAARAHLGISKTAPGSVEGLLRYVHPDDREVVQRALHQSVQPGEIYQVEFRATNAAGEPVWLTARSQAEIAEDGKPVRLRGTLQDITERKASEAELELQRSELAHVQRVSAVGYLASALAHELSQPLAAILRNAEAGELILRKDPPDLDELRALLEDIQRDEQRAAGVIDRMRLLLKHRRPEYDTLDMCDLVEQTMTLVQPETQARRIVPQIRIAPALPSILGDRVQLQQVLLNLVTNALDAMSEAPVEKRRLAVTVRGTCRSGVEVAVSDTGTGIAAEQLSTVFEPFWTTKKKGLGMGLPLSKMIVDAHGGRIWAEGNPEGGAILRFTLPAASGGGAP